jgi:hypothetical protein
MDEMMYQVSRIVKHIKSQKFEEAHGRFGVAKAGRV